jgi:hypothetical protein
MHWRQFAVIALVLAVITLASLDFNSKYFGGFKKREELALSEAYLDPHFFERLFPDNLNCTFTMRLHNYGKNSQAFVYLGRIFWAASLGCYVCWEDEKRDSVLNFIDEATLSKMCRHTNNTVDPFYQYHWGEQNLRRSLCLRLGFRNEFACFQHFFLNVYIRQQRPIRTDVLQTPAAIVHLRLADERVDERHDFIPALSDSEFGSLLSMMQEQWYSTTIYMMSPDKRLNSIMDRTR